MSERNLVIITRIIAYYCAFYMGIKLYYVIRGIPDAAAHLVLAIALFLIAFVGFYLLHKNKQHWGYAVFGIIAVSLLRYYELDLVVWLQGVLGN